MYVNDPNEICFSVPLKRDWTTENRPQNCISLCFQYVSLYFHFYFYACYVFLLFSPATETAPTTGKSDNNLLSTFHSVFLFRYFSLFYFFHGFSPKHPESHQLPVKARFFAIFWSLFLSGNILSSSSSF